MRASADTQISFAFADAVNVATFFRTNSCTLSGACPVSVKHVVGHPVIASRAVQMGHRREVVHQLSRQAALE
jgi:hypothetical protein